LHDVGHVTQTVHPALGYYHISIGEVSLSPEVLLVPDKVVVEEQFPRKIFKKRLGDMKQNQKDFVRIAIPAHPLTLSERIHAGFRQVICSVRKQIALLKTISQKVAEAFLGCVSIGANHI
jgi:hypothetical protein